jgi:predicted Fe-Mo cluster-binding NifX family protein
MARGAGIQAAEHVANSGAEVVLTGYVGPKAFKALQAAGIRVAQDLADMTVRQAVEMFVNDKIEWAGRPNRQAHGR